MNAPATLSLPLPRLEEGRFASCVALTDQALFDACGVRIAFTQRVGGVSTGPYAGLNLGTHVDDDPAQVARNHKILREALGVAEVPVIQPRQVHGTEVLTCTSAARGRELATPERPADAVVVTCADVAALLCFADCVPVVGVAASGAFFVAHAGWRGVADRIVEAALERLVEADSADPGQINIYLGPYIHACHFEVESDLRERFAEGFGRDCVADQNHVDLGLALRESLRCCGIDPARIADADVCTVCEGGARFYSYRLNDGVCGRFGAFAVRPGCVQEAC